MRERGWGKRFLMSLPMLLMIVVPYVIAPLFGTYMVALEGGAEEGAYAHPLLVGLGFVCAVIIYVLNYVYPFILGALGADSRQLFFWNMILKLLNIPLYLFVFVMGFAMLIAFFGIVMIPGLMFFDYMMLLPTSMYGISGLYRARKRNQISTAWMVIHILMQLCFCLDVVSAIASYIKVRKN